MSGTRRATVARGAAGEGRHDRQCRRARASARLLRGLQRRRQFQRGAPASSTGAIRSTSSIRASRSSAIPAAAARIPPSMRCCTMRETHVCRRSVSPRSNPGRIRAGLQHTNRPDPQSGLDGKFSIQYVLARALMHGIVSMEHFSDDAVRDPATRALMTRVHAAPDPAAEERDQRSLLLPPEDHDHGRRDLRAFRRIARSAATGTIRCRPARWKRNSATARRPCSTRKAVETVLAQCHALETLPDVSDVVNVIATGVKPPAVATRSRAYA